MLLTLLVDSHLPFSKGVNDIILKTIEELEKRHLDDGNYQLTGILLSSHSHKTQWDKKKHVAALQKIKVHFPNMPIVGGSSTGQLIAKEAIQNDSMTLLIFVTDDNIHIHAGYVEDISVTDNIVKAFRHSKQTLNGTEKLCLIFPAFVTDVKVDFNNLKNGKWTGVIPAIRAEISTQCKIIGGICTDYWGEFRRDKSKMPLAEESCQYFDDKILEKGMPYLIFAGQNFKVANGYGCGWEPRDEKTYPITIDKNGKVISIDHQNPMQFLQAQNYPLASADPQKKALYFLEPIILKSNKSRKFAFWDLFIDQRDNSLHIWADIPNNSDITLQFTVPLFVKTGTFESLKNAKNVANAKDFSPSVVILFSCITRGIFFEEQHLSTYEYTEAAFQYKDTPILIFYCFGEIGPQSPRALTTLNGLSVITLAIGEKDFQENKRSQLDDNLNEFSNQALGLILNKLKTLDNQRLPAEWCSRKSHRYIEGQLIKWLKNEFGDDIELSTLTNYIRILKEQAND